MHLLICVAALLLPTSQPEPPKPVTRIPVRVLDEAGKPAPNIPVGSYAGRDVTDAAELDWVLYFTGAKHGDVYRTGPDGTIALDTFIVLGAPEDDRARPIIAWTPDRSRVALVECKPEDIGRTIDLKLAPACKITVRATCTGLESLGRTLEWSNTYIYFGAHRPFACNSTNGVHEFMVPPGEYRVCCYGRGTYTTFTPLTIAPGDEEKTVETDLPASRLTRITGKPAPELAKIKGWKNGGPVTLADLKGKVVLLDFWGHWCGPCVRAMPELMELHDTYKDKGLVVIAVHDDSVESIKEMDGKLEKIRAEIWNGRDLPFLIALDGGGETLIEGFVEKARGATTAAYGIDTFPTKVLIDRSGRVIGPMRKGNDGVEMLKKALDEPASKDH
jgi:thiol-disulfide isomerase/thioredoxin